MNKRLSGPVGRRGRSREVLAAVSVSLLVLSACNGDDGGVAAEASQRSVEGGASQEDYIAALEDMAPVELTFQSVEGPDAAFSKPLQAYAEALEEWSGGKITVELVYGSAVAGPTDVDEALLDGRLDGAHFIPLFQPEEYPASDALARINTFAAQQQPLGIVHETLGNLSLALETDALTAELEDQGIKPVVPYFPITGIGLTCSSERSSLGELEGAQARGSIVAHGRQIEALGMSSVQIQFPEMFEAFERGTVDCAVTSLVTANQLGLMPAAPHWVIDDKATFASPPNVLAMNMDVWEDLPLAAQQLLHDRADVFLEEAMYAMLDDVAAAVQELREAGGTVSEFDADAREAIQAANDKLRDSVREGGAFDNPAAVVERVESTMAEWRSVVTDELGIGEVSYDKYGDWYSRDKVDLDPVVDRLNEEILQPVRPTSD